MTAASAPPTPRAGNAVALMKATNAAAGVAATSPTVIELGLHLAAVEMSYDAHDHVSLCEGLSGDDREGHRQAGLRNDQAWKILGDRAEALRDVITSIPAATLQDVAVQISVIGNLADRMSGSVLSASQMASLSGRIERMAYGMLPVAAGAAGLKMDDMGWAEGDALRVTRFAGVGVVA